MTMNIPARLRSLPLPASAIALGAAFVLGMLNLQVAGWLLFGLGALAWVRLDAKNLLRSDLYGLAPAFALLAYPVLAGSQASAGVTFGLALHALAVFLILVSRHVAEETSQAFSQQKGINQGI